MLSKPARARRGLRHAARGLRALSAAAVLLFFASLASAQTGGIEVQVRDTDGQPLPGATVTLSNTSGFVGNTTIFTDKNGRAQFPVLRAGAGYAVEVGFPGRARQKVANLRVTSGQTLKVPFRMTEEIREIVEVKASRPVVDLEDSDSSVEFSDQFLQDLPVQGRFYQNVLTLAPGVLDSDGDGNPNVHGSRSRDFKTSVSGVSNVDPLTGERLSFVNPESIEELQVIPAGAGVEFGRAQGGFAQILQKQGTNDFEGVFSFLYSSSKLDGNGATNLSGSRVPDFGWLQPGFQLSGPIVHDKLWFRLSHEWIKKDEPVNTLTSVETVGREQTIASDQITWQVSPRNKLTFQFQYDPLILTNVGFSARIPSESSQRQELGGKTYSLTWTAAQSPRLLVESLVAYQDARVNVLPNVPGQSNSCLVNPLYPILDQAQCFWIDRNSTTGSYPITSRDNRQRFTFSTHAEYEAGQWAGASHRIKFGFSSENERYFRTLTQTPDLEFEVDDFHFGTGSYRLPFPQQTNARVTGANWSFWAEDRMRIGSSLSVALGLRLDDENIHSGGWSYFDPEAEAAAFDQRVGAGESSEIAKRQEFTAYQSINDLTRYLAEVLGVASSSRLLSALTRDSAFWDENRLSQDIDLHNSNLAPRLSVSWDPWANGKTKFVATAGRYFDKIFLGVPLIELEPATVIYTFPALARGGPGRFEVVGQPDEGAAISTRIVSRDLRTPYQDEITLGFEREISPETALKLTWIDRRFKDQLQDVDVNHATHDYGSCTSTSPWVFTGNGPDGKLDDCYLGPDGFPDLYINNPGWEEVLLVGNFNESRYHALVAEIVRRLYRSWQMEGSYTWSRAEGSAEDFNQLLSNDRTNVEDERGLLAYDQTHVLKFSGTVILPRSVRLGGTVSWESGLPYSILVSEEIADAVAPRRLGGSVSRFRLQYPTHQRNDQRNESFWTWNARLSKDWVLGGVNLSLTAEVFNLLNDDALRIYDRTNGVNNATRRFGRRWQIGTRLAF